MVVDFAKVNVKDTPVLILQNLDDTPTGVLGFAYNTEAKLCYNEISTLTFDLPAFVDGSPTAHYDRVTGMRVVDLKNYGRFILLDPKIVDDGLREIKTCNAYSLEYEFTFKKMVLSEGTYNFWNPMAQGGTILGMILESMPSWRVGNIDASLIDKYRTFDGSGDQNIYNFMKSELQEAYGCIFYFDTYERLIHVRDIMTEAPVKPVYFSVENLVKKINIDEDTESITTCLNVTGADGVDIRSVNPMGTNYIIDLGYFMTPENFSQAMLDKYAAWRQTFESYQRQYYNLTIDEALRTAQLVTEQAALTTLQGEMTSLENIQATIIQAIAQKLKSQSDLNAVNAQIASKMTEINAKKMEIAGIQSDTDSLNSQMVDINNRTHIKSFFTADEYKILNRYFKEATIAENSFVVSTVDTYDAAGESVRLDGSIFNVTNSRVTKVVNQLDKDIYSMVGGRIACSTSGLVLDAELIRASLDYDAEKNFVFTARLNAGIFNGEQFPSGCISIAGKATSITSNVTPDSETHGAYLDGTTLSFKLGAANFYFTRSTTAYEQRAVEWDLFDYGQNLLKKIAYPAYSCSLDIVNFMALEECEAFKNKLELGSKLYWKQRNGKVLTPILVDVTIPFFDLDNFKVSISSKYNSADAEFSYEDLISEGVHAGKTLDAGRWSYNQFVNSGAETSLGKFMRSALDIARNSIIATTGQAITWDEAGFRLRKRKEGAPLEYEPYQIWMNNSSIMFSTDNWSTANLAIGQMTSEDGGVLSGVIADSLIGKLIAGNSMIIESEKKAGGVSVFRVDGSGASLHNATFDIYNGSNTQITLNPYSGIAIGKYPLYSGNEYTINTTNAKFWVDTDGNVHLKGTLHGVDGTFSGELQAATGRFKGVVQASGFQDLNGRNMLTGDYKFAPDYLELKGLNVNNNFIVDSNGNVTMRGNIVMNSGTISWANINESASTAYKNANAANQAANEAYNRAIDAEDVARRIAAGTFSGASGSFINRREIYGPTIYANELKVIPEGVGTSNGRFSLSGYYGSTLMEALRIAYNAGLPPTVVFSSPDGGAATWAFNQTFFGGIVGFSGSVSFTDRVDFSRATVVGIEARFA